MKPTPTTSVPQNTVDVVAEMVWSCTNYRRTPRSCRRIYRYASNVSLAIMDAIMRTTATKPRRLERSGIESESTSKKEKGRLETKESHVPACSGTMLLGAGLPNG